MKITKRQLRKIINEAIGGTAEYGPNAGTPWIDVVIGHLEAGDVDSAGQAVLDSYMMDDTWQSEEDMLEEMLDDAWSQDPSVENIQNAVDWWYTQLKDGMYRPQSQEEEREDWKRGAEKARARSTKAVDKKKYKLMKITKRQLKRIIKEEASRLLEYEQHVYTDKDGVTWLVDDEGNRERKSSQFGRSYGGDGGGTTYTGTRPPWSGSRRSRSPRKTSYVGAGANTEQISAIEAVLAIKANKFLTSILNQLKKGRGLSEKQKAIVRKIVVKHDPQAATLFESSTKKYDDDSALKGDQSKLPDGLQKGIIDKTVKDREDHEEEERKEKKNETLRLTLGQLRKIVKEGIDIVNNETGELLVFEDDWQDGSADAPEAAARNIMKRLGIIQLSSEIDGDIESIEVHPEDWAKMDVELRGKRHYRKNKREQERMDIDNLLARADRWATDASGDYGADNPEVDMQDVAWDLAAGAQFQFREDEWDELIWHFDDSEDELITYIADRIAG